MQPFHSSFKGIFLKLWIIYTKKKIQKSIFLSIFCQPADISIVATVKSVFQCHFCWIFESNNLYVTGIASDFWGKNTYLLCCSELDEKIDKTLMFVCYNMKLQPVDR